MPAQRPRSAKPRARRAARAPAPELPVARVVVDIPLAHLDRPFDYLVDERFADVGPGCRVRVRFAGQLVDGFVLERVAASDHQGSLAFLERVVSAESVLTDEIAGLARAVADRWAGTMADVLRLAVPPRHAAAEAGLRVAEVPLALDPARRRTAGAGDMSSLAAAVAGGEPVRAVVTLPAVPWQTAVADLVVGALSGDRSVVVVVPDHRDVVALDAELVGRLGSDRHVVLEAGLGPAERYRRFLAVRRGAVRCVVGTRAAVWAPVTDLGLLVVWDDGDDLHAERRAPYCHSRDVAILRAHRAGAGLVLAGHAVSGEGAALVARGWARRIDATKGGTAPLPARRLAADGSGADDPVARSARIPTAAWRAARDALAAGAPVLVQVPRAGYQPGLACNGCRRAARCARCSGPLERAASNRPVGCRWCGVATVDWRCPACGSTTLRSVVVGSVRTAEELGRAFPGTSVRVSGGDHVVATVPDRPALVVATPGAEPVAAGGYGAAVLLDGWALLSRPDLRAGEETLRRWLNAAALVRPADAGGLVVVDAAPELRPVQALLRWRPWWHAERENADRAELHLPPFARVAGLTGAPDVLAEFLQECDLPVGAEVLGPVDVPAAADQQPEARALVRVPHQHGQELATGLKAAAAVRSARKAAPVRVELDPVVIG